MSNLSAVLLLQSNVSVIIPTYKRPEMLYDLINSIRYYNSLKNLEIIVVDNNSGIKYDFKCPVKLLFNYDKGNLAKSRNIGARFAKGDYLFFIDDDNIITKNCIQHLTDYMDKNPNCDIAAPLAYLHGTDKLIDAGAFRSMWTGFTTNNRCVYEPPFYVDEVSNAFIVRKSSFKELDEVNFPIELDEADLCFGKKVVMVPQSKVYHKANLSFVYRRPENAYYSGRNRILFQAKHCTKLQFWTWFLIFQPMFVAFYTLIFLIYKREFIKPFIKGVKDGLFKLLS